MLTLTLLSDYVHGSKVHPKAFNKLKIQPISQTTFNVAASRLFNIKLIRLLNTILLNCNRINPEETLQILINNKPKYSKSVLICTKKPLLNMLSKSLMFFVFHFFKACQLFGALALTFDETTQTFSTITAALRRLKANFCLNLVWTTAISLNILRFSKSTSHRDEFHLTVLYLLGILVGLIALSMVGFFQKDVCISLNGFLKHMQYLKSKLSYCYRIGRMILTL